MKRRRSCPENGAFCTWKGGAGGEPGQRLWLWQLLVPLRLCPPALQRVDPLLQGLHLPVHSSHCGRKQPGSQAGLWGEEGEGAGERGCRNRPEGWRRGRSQKGLPHLQLRRTEIRRSSSERCRDSSVTTDGCAWASGRAEGEEPAGDALQAPSASLRRLPAKKGHLLMPPGAPEAQVGGALLLWGREVHLGGGRDICPGGSRMVLETSTPQDPGPPTQGETGGWGSLEGAAGASGWPGRGGGGRE